MPHKDPVKRATYLKQWRANNPDKCSEYLDRRDPVKIAAYHKKNSAGRRVVKSETAARWRQNNPEKLIFMRARNNARQHKMEFSLTLDHISIPKVCPYLGLELVWSPNTPRSDNAPSLDRIDNTKGYVPENVEVISWRANQLKHNATADELTMIAVRMADTETRL